jgi:hypothetical protein
MLELELELELDVRGMGFTILYNTTKNITESERRSRDVGFHQHGMAWHNMEWALLLRVGVAGERDCRLLIVNLLRFGAGSKGRKGWLYISTSHTSKMYFIVNAGV